MLKHTFNRAATANSFADGDLKDNLMEYYGGTKLVKLQWDAIHNPGTVIGIFERDEDAMQMITGCTAGTPSWNGSKEGEATFTFGEVVSAYDGFLKGREKPECYKTWYWNVDQNKWLTPNEYHKIKRRSNNQILFNKSTDEFFENDDSFEGHVYNHNRLEKSTHYSLMPISSILSENEMYQLAFLRAFQLDDFKIEDNFYLDLTFKAALDHVYYFFTESTVAKAEASAKEIDPNVESGLENVTLALFASSADSINEAVRVIKHSNSIFFKFNWGITLGYIISPFAPKINSALLKVSNKVEQSIFKAGGYLRVRAVDWAKKFKLKGNIGTGARQRAIAKFGKEAEDLIYVKFNKHGGAAAEIIDHFGTDGLNALKKVSNIQDAASELIKGKIMYRAINETTYNFNKLKTQGLIDASPKQYPTYVSLDKIIDAGVLKSKLQLPKRPTWLAEFDANQILNDIHFANGKYLNADYIEVLCRSYPELGIGGASQFITNSPIKIKRLINLESGEIINF